MLKKLLVRHLFLSFRLFRGHDVWHHRIQKPPLSAIPHKNDTPLWGTFSKTCVFGARKRRLPPYGRKAKNQNGEDGVKLLKTRPKGLQIFCKLREKRIGRRKQERFVIQRYRINPERYSWSNYSLWMNVRWKVNSAETYLRQGSFGNTWNVKSFLHRKCVL